jgi:DNA-binding NarL/FixJ family response regulator
MNLDHPEHGYELIENKLTPGQRAIARLIAEGLRNREIAARLFLGYGTVKNQISDALRRTGTSNRVQLIRWLSDHREQS